MNKRRTVADVIRDTQDSLLATYPESVLFGLGVNDPKRVFGTTAGLYEKYGEGRVFETPTSENAMLGVAVGMAISGMKPIVIHQRLDFFLLAMDQLVNSAAKWRYMFGDVYETTMIIRLIVGRGWGQGPTHSQNLHSWFTHIPGLRVFFPSFGQDYKEIFMDAFQCKYPSIILEDRWIHQSSELEIPSNEKSPLAKSRVMKEGVDLTLITFGFNTILGIQVCSFFKNLDISIEHIDLFSLKPIDISGILDSSLKTRRILIVDSGFEFASFGSYLSHRINERLSNLVEISVKVLTAGDLPEPTSHGVISQVKISAEKIAREIGSILKLSRDIEYHNLQSPLVDVPDATFQGPF